MLSGYQMLKDAIIVMESPNLGHPSKIRVDGGWETWNRSYPYSNGGHGFRGADPFVGVRIHNEGPLHLHNVTFMNFRTNRRNQACAIRFQDNFNFGMGPGSS